MQIQVIVVPRFWSVHGKCTERISAQYIPMYQPKAEYNYYVSRSIARSRVVVMDFVHDIEKDDFLKELEVTINPFRWLLGRPYFPNQRASGHLSNEQGKRLNPRALEYLPSERRNSSNQRVSEYLPNKRGNCRTNEAEDTYRKNQATVMASSNRKSEKQPFSTTLRTSKNGSSQEYSREYTMGT